MNRYFSLAVMGLVLGGCAADFSEDRSPETNAPDQTEQTDDGTTVNTFGGQLQRPAETLGTVDEAAQTAHSNAIRTYVGRVDEVEIELGPKFNRSMSQ